MCEQVSFLADEEVSGIQFAKLHYRRPDLGPELSVLRTRLLEKVAGQAQEMKVWTMRDLGLQTLQSMRNSRRPEVAMIDAIQNFPMRAPDLSSIKVQLELSCSFEFPTICVHTYVPFDFSLMRTPYRFHRLSETTLRGE